MKNKSLIIFGIVSILITGFIFYQFKSIGSKFTSSENTIEKKLQAKKERFEFFINENSTSPHSMDLIMQGHVNGTAILKHGWTDSTYHRIDTISNQFNIEYIAEDWYWENLIVNYIPLTADEGDLKIDCILFSREN